MSLSVLLLASLLGTWVDRGKSRLTTLITTISANRISVIAACICWFFVVGLEGAGAIKPTAEEPKAEPTGFVGGLKNSLFVVVLVLSVIERSSRTANIFSLERDWVPVMVTPESISKTDDPPPTYALAELNAVLSRIDLICKLISPIVMSTFISMVGSVEFGILAVLSLNALTWTAEIWSARSVWKSCDQLRVPKQFYVKGQESNDVEEISDIFDRPSNKFTSDTTGPWWQRTGQRVYEAFQAVIGGTITCVKCYAVNFHIYFGHAVWLPSIALSTLHFSVLNYSATLSTYLNQSAGFSWNLITVAKALSAVAEIGSTFFTPWGVRQVGKMWARREDKTSESRVTRIRHDSSEALLPAPRLDDHDEENFIPPVDMGVAVLGLWSLIQMLISLVGTPALFLPSSQTKTFRFLLVSPSGSSPSQAAPPLQEYHSHHQPLW